MKVLTAISTIMVVIVSVYFFSGCTTDVTTPPVVAVVTDTIKVQSPNGGEQFFIGDSMVITWTANSAIISKVIIDISIDNGRIYRSLTEGGLPVNDSSLCKFSWKIPESFREYSADIEDFIIIPASSTKCIIRIKDYNRPIMDFSDGQFTIATR